MHIIYTTVLSSHLLGGIIICLQCCLNYNSASYLGFWNLWLMHEIHFAEGPLKIPEKPLTDRENCEEIWHCHV